MIFFKEQIRYISILANYFLKLIFSSIDCILKVKVKADLIEMRVFFGNLSWLSNQICNESIKHALNDGQFYTLTDVYNWTKENAKGFFNSIIENSLASVHLKEDGLRPEARCLNNVCDSVYHDPSVTVLTADIKNEDCLVFFSLLSLYLATLSVCLFLLFCQSILPRWAICFCVLPCANIKFSKSSSLLQDSLYLRSGQPCWRKANL